MGVLEQDYEESRDIIEKARVEIANILERQLGVRGVENREAYFAIQDFLKRAEITITYLNYLALPTREGTLIRDKDNNKFIIAYDDKTQRNWLVGGDPLEVLIGGNWLIGRIEKKGAEFYFHGEENSLLEEGMKVRLRMTRKFFSPPGRIRTHGPRD